METKAWSKPENVWEMDFDGERVHIKDRGSDGAPITQCRAEVAQIRSLLKESTSRSFPVQGVVLLFDWYVNQRDSARGSSIWLLNPKQLEGKIGDESQTLSDDEVAMATLHLKQYVKKLAA